MGILPLHASAPTRANIQADRYKAIASFRREAHKRFILRLRYKDLSGHILALSLLLISMFPSMFDQPLLSGSARRAGGRLYDLEYDDRVMRAFVEGVPDGMARRNEGGVKASLLVQHLA
ncbi:hypothetical protein B9Z65_8157 [Elsinoe australis]|uniref:Uncharacterized protein n=1 Tax=Elsinoe australis TaxID=40998 RepID=A0A2P7YWA3_9PEZI|nr:hypothetical protein B9Z65_8157 [Elsinoe australis]